MATPCCTSRAHCRSSKRLLCPSRRLPRYPSVLAAPHLIVVRHARPRLPRMVPEEHRLGLQRGVLLREANGSERHASQRTRPSNSHLAAKLSRSPQGNLMDQRAGPPRARAVVRPALRELFALLPLLVNGRNRIAQTAQNGRARSREPELANPHGRAGQPEAMRDPVGNARAQLPHRDRCPAAATRTGRATSSLAPRQGRSHSGNLSPNAESDRVQDHRPVARNRHGKRVLHGVKASLRGIAREGHRNSGQRQPSQALVGHATSSPARRVGASHSASHSQSGASELVPVRVPALQNPHGEQQSLLGRIAESRRSKTARQNLDGIGRVLRQRDERAPPRAASLVSIGPDRLAAALRRVVSDHVPQSFDLVQAVQRVRVPTSHARSVLNLGQRVGATPALAIAAAERNPAGQPIPERASLRFAASRASRRRKVQNEEHSICRRD
jgi:hypothetical protein